MLGKKLQLTFALADRRFSAQLLCLALLLLPLPNAAFALCFHLQSEHILQQNGGSVPCSCSGLQFERFGGKINNWLNEVTIFGLVSFFLYPRCFKILPLQMCGSAARLGCNMTPLL